MARNKLNMMSTGLANVEGILVTLRVKEEVAGHLKQIMLEKKLQIPYDQKLIDQLNVETFEITKEGGVRFSHQESAHDDQFWVLALACAAGRGVQPTFKMVGVPKT